MPIDPTTVIKEAATSGWVVSLLVLLVLGGFTSYGWLLKQLYVDLQSLRTFQQNTLIEIIRSNTALMTEVKEALENIGQHILKNPKT